MLTGRHFLFIPGPTHVPERILRALSRPMLDHRGPSFPPLSQALLRDLEKVFKTENAQVFIFPSSGTGAWEATLYTQDWTPDSDLPSTIATAFGERSWRAAFWWDTEGRYQGQAVRTGVLALQADAEPGWVVARNDAPDEGDPDWWPHLETVLAGAVSPGGGGPGPG